MSVANFFSFVICLFILSTLFVVKVAGGVFDWKSCRPIEDRVSVFVYEHLLTRDCPSQATAELREEKHVVR